MEALLFFVVNVAAYMASLLSDCRVACLRAKSTDWLHRSLLDARSLLTSCRAACCELCAQRAEATYDSRRFALLTYCSQRARST